MFEIGFTSVTFRKKTIEEVCAIAYENNIKNIEWGGDIHLPPADEKAIKRINESCKKYGLKSVSYGSYYKLGCNDFVLFEKIVDTANKIGAKTIRIWQGEKSSKDVTDFELQNMIEETKIFADTAIKKDITIAFEFHKNTNNDNGQSSIEFIKSVNKPNVKTYWQPFSTNDDIKNLKTVIPYLACVHIFEWNEKGKRYSLKHGRQKWLDFLCIIKSENIKPVLIMEFVKHNSKKQFAKDVKILKKLIEQDSLQCQR